MVDSQALPETQLAISETNDQPKQKHIITFMDAERYNAAAEGQIHKLNYNYTKRLDLLRTPDKNALLHVYITAVEKDTKESTKFVALVISKCPLLLVEPNNKDETPLHIAARFGRKHIVEFLIHSIKKAEYEDLERAYALVNFRSKLDEKSEKCIFIGYSPHSKAYRLYNPISGKVIISRDVVFNEEAVLKWNSDKEGIKNQVLGDFEVEQPASSAPSSPTSSAPSSPGDNNATNSTSSDSLASSPSTNSSETSPRKFRSLREIYESCDFAFLVTDPTSFEEAAEQPTWQIAMTEEMQAIEKNSTWELVDIPEGKNVVGLKWVFRTNTNEQTANVFTKSLSQAKHQFFRSQLRSTSEMLKKTSPDEDTALHEAVRNNHPQLVETLIRENPEFANIANAAGESPLYLAAVRENNIIASEILTIGPSPAFTGPDGRTALHEAVISGDIDLTRKMLDKNKSLNKEQDEEGWTPLHYASYFNLPQIVEMLLEDNNKSAAYIGDNDGKTPLHIAIICGKSHLNVVKKIMSDCPDCCELADNSDRNVLHFAVETGSLGVQIITEEPSLANLINQKDKEGNTPAI
ncbi:hypothetical protein GH714_030132 [Hevea brasiliensis]|uniref:Retroviral polymerase SH3-like domain-containing protein n=1 Tax=Hevea brasiliensis TaxID=3981 RepID=A0A6A6N804_HEVBR|nr:hypothetical protein GH714_030132 [Hevea brasiliensis]